MLCLGAENQAILHCPTLARLCYSTLFSLTGLFQDCSPQEDVWTFWKNHHFFSESIHRQFVLCVCVCVCTHTQACVLDCVWLFATPWTPLSMEFSRQECWSGSPFPIPRDLRCRDRTHVSCILYFREILYHCVTWEAQSLQHPVFPVSHPRTNRPNPA